MSGRVLERTVRPGDTSAPGTTLFRIARDGLVELDAEIPEADLARIKPGDRAHGDACRPATRWSGAVRLDQPAGRPADQARPRPHRRCRCAPDLRPGGFARAVFRGRAAPRLAVAPESAVRFDADGACVMMVDARQPRPPRAGADRRALGGLVELVQGPPPGTRVALGGGGLRARRRQGAAGGGQPAAAGAKAAGR